MKISLAQTQWFDDQGYPLVAGRVSVYLHESDTLATVYTLEGETFTQAQNPFILDNGGRCPTGSIWFDAAVVDVKVEKYNGVPGSYSQVDRYEDGFEVPGVTNDSVIVGIDGLVDANPELGVVTVVGYHNAHDCGARQFVWDPNCTVNEDGGAIIASGTAENGRWILLSDSRYMPSTYYGIKAGSLESNIAAFLTYPETVGQWSIKLPPVPRFKAGTYTSNGTMSTPKTVAFDTGAKFTNMSFTVNAVEIMHNVDYVADFIFAKQQLAKSSWFRSVSKFWTCGARELYQERTNYFASNALNNSYWVSHQKVSGYPVAMTGVGVLMFEDCDFEDGSLSTAWYTLFKDCRFSDRWYADSTWDFGATPAHHIALAPASNTVKICNFQDANAYVLWAAAYSVGAIDLEGREVDTVDANMHFTYIANARIGALHSEGDISIDNCSVSSAYLEDYSATFSATGSSVTFVDTRAMAIVLDDCKVSLAADIDNLHTSLYATGTSFSLSTASIVRSSASDHVNFGAVELSGCDLHGGEVQCGAPSISGTILENTVITVIPGLNSGTYHLSVFFKGNTVKGTGKLRIVPATENSGATGVQEVIVDGMNIVDNTFSTSSPGIVMPFWASDGEHRFIGGVTGFTAPGDMSDWSTEYFTAPYVYAGNTGNCPNAFGKPTPASATSPVAIASSWSTDVNPGMRFMAGVGQVSVFALPTVSNANGDALPEPVINNGVYEVSNLSVTVPYRGKAIATEDSSGVGGGVCLDFPRHGYLPACAYDKSLPNDMFSCLVGAYGLVAQLHGINPVRAD